MASNKRKTEVDKDVEFYRIIQKATDFGKVDIDKIAKELHLAEKQDYNSKVLFQNSETFRCFAFSDKNGNHGASLAISRNIIPPVLTSKAGIDGIQVPQGKQISEYCYLMFFKPNYVGVVMHQHSPTMTNFSEFLRNNIPALGQLSFELCVNPNFFDRLNSLEEIKGFRFKITQSTASKIKSIDRNFGEYLEQGLNFGFRNIYFNFTNGRSYNEATAKFVDKLVRGIIKKPKAREEFKSLNLKVTGNKKDITQSSIIDIFTEKITAERTFPYEDNGKSRVLDKEIAFSLIVDAYNEMKNQVRESASLGEADDEQNPKPKSK